MAAQNDLELILSFLAAIGIPVVEKELGKDTFLPGLALDAGCILADYEKLKYPGDLLHEAGHLAVTTPGQRDAIGTEALELPWPTDGEEIGAVLWSYAAALKIGLAPEVVFHSGGYKNESEWIIGNFTSGNYIGLPFLEWAGLTLGPQRAEEQGIPAFPHMINWIRS